jgi:hypothetical protein
VPLLHRPHLVVTLPLNIEITSGPRAEPKKLLKLLLRISMASRRDGYALDLSRPAQARETLGGQTEIVGRRFFRQKAGQIVSHQ